MSKKRGKIRVFSANFEEYGLKQPILRSSSVDCQSFNELLFFIYNGFSRDAYYSGLSIIFGLSAVAGVLSALFLSRFANYPLYYFFEVLIDWDTYFPYVSAINWAIAFLIWIKISAARRTSSGIFEKEMIEQMLAGEFIYQNWQEWNRTYGVKITIKTEKYKNVDVDKMFGVTKERARKNKGRSILISQENAMTW